MAQGIVDDVLAPKNLIIPVLSSTSSGDKPLATDAGQIWISGGKLYFADGSTIQNVTSA